jgi:hypothetical protein
MSSMMNINNCAIFVEIDLVVKCLVEFIMYAIPQEQVFLNKEKKKKKKKKKIFLNIRIVLLQERLRYLAKI